mmetsp:Transcript_27337/g.43985  ORF Transcript_27337/g.43985 Transcript_27337/m.43985 type:complete len:314 (-) Transcript_27337:140-1081(-)
MDNSDIREEEIRREEEDNIMAEIGYERVNFTEEDFRSLSHSRLPSDNRRNLHGGGEEEDTLLKINATYVHGNEKDCENTNSNCEGSDGANAVRIDSQDYKGHRNDHSSYILGENVFEYDPGDVRWLPLNPENETANSILREQNLNLIGDDDMDDDEGPQYQWKRQGGLRIDDDQSEEEEGGENAPVTSKTHCLRTIDRETSAESWSEDSIQSKLSLVEERLAQEERNRLGKMRLKSHSRPTKLEKEKGDAATPSRSNIGDEQHSSLRKQENNNNEIHSMVESLTLKSHDDGDNTDPRRRHSLNVIIGGEEELL